MFYIIFSAAKTDFQKSDMATVATQYARVPNFPCQSEHIVTGTTETQLSVNVAESGFCSPGHNIQHGKKSAGRRG